MKNKIQFILISVIFLLFSISVYAKADKLRLMYNKSINSMTLAWVQVDGKSPTIFFDSDENFKKNKSLNKAISPQKSYKYLKMYHYFATFNNLKPNTIYHFIIKDSKEESQVYWFKTMSKNPEKISVIAGGDSRSQPSIRRLANRMVAKLQPDFVIFDGDFTSANSSAQWAQWLDDWQLTITNGRIIPIIPVMGNHERGNVMPNIFDIPEDSYYSLDFSNILHLTVLNTNINITGAQTDWLIKDLNSISDSWKFTVFHKPMRPHYSHKSEGDDIYDAWANIFFKHKIDIVLDGDTHVNKITYPIRPSTKYDSEEGFIRDDENGTIYLGEGTWGAPLRPFDDTKSWTMDGASIYQFKWIFISNNKVQIRTVKFENVDNVDNLSFDNRFSIPKNIDIWKPLGQEFVEIIK
ncbi:MAG: metallophosphoesterase family protein [Bacteroidota bacterium]|nr:metallophosphoesterase family protein [Bacteroidota bacterium]